MANFRSFDNSMILREVLGSLILPLYSCIVFTRFYYNHFPSVNNYDSNPAESVRFNDPTTLPLHSFRAFLQDHNTSDTADDSVILGINT
jgi:hypothetical protein